MAMNKFFRIPFALSGDKNTVPDASQPSGSVSYTDGFGPDYELDPAVDPSAKDVPRDETNQLYFDITNAIKEYQEFGVPDFITSALNGGVPFSYSRFARVKWTDGRVYESRTNSNTTDPTNATNWRPLTDNIDYLTIATTAFEPSVSDGEAVFWDASNNRFDEAIANGTSAQNVIGFADVTNGRVFVAGLYAGQLSGLTANIPYFLSPTTPGAITSAGGAVRMGVSRNATSIFVSIGASAAQATEAVAGIAEIATQVETNTGTNDTNIVTPSKLASATSRGLGYGQTWQDVTGSRAFGTTYTNTTGKPIEVQIQGSLNAGSIYSVTINGAIRNRFGAPNTNGQCPVSFVVPNGSTYSAAVTSGAGSLQLWNELR